MSQHNEEFGASATRQTQYLIHRKQLVDTAPSHRAAYVIWTFISIASMVDEPPTYIDQASNFLCYTFILESSGNFANWSADVFLSLWSHTGTRANAHTRASRHCMCKNHQNNYSTECIWATDAGNSMNGTIDLPKFLAREARLKPQNQGTYHRSNANQSSEAINGLNIHRLSKSPAAH